MVQSNAPATNDRDLHFDILTKLQHSQQAFVQYTEGRRQKTEKRKEKREKRKEKREKRKEKKRKISTRITQKRTSKRSFASLTLIDAVMKSPLGDTLSVW